jgi:ribonuclease P protein component
MTFEDTHEAYFSAQPARPRSSPRLPRSRSHRRWPQGAGRSPCAWPQEAFGLILAGERSQADPSPTDPAPEQAARPRISVMTRRADFLAANRGLRVARPGFVLLANSNGGHGLRFGITVTKKIGNAVVRNRMKRRFRALLRELLPERGLADTDHVVIGREGGIERDFSTLRDELAAALARARDGKGDKPRPPRTKR